MFHNIYFGNQYQVQQFKLNQPISVACIFLFKIKGLLSIMEVIFQVQCVSICRSSQWGLKLEQTLIFFIFFIQAILEDEDFLTHTVKVP